MSELPINWIYASIGQLFKLVGGGTPSTSNSKYWVGDIPWITSADITKDHRINTRKMISQLAVENSAANIVPAGSIIVATRVGLGKCAVSQNVLCFSQDCQGLLSYGTRLSSSFFTYQLESIASSIIQKGRGTTINGITKGTLLHLLMRVPPISEQHHIVEAIESYLTRLDDSINALKGIQRKLKKYRASVLKAAVEGRLVPTEAELAREEGRDYEPASVLLECILKERRQRWIEDTAEKGRARAEEKAKKSGKSWTDDDNVKALSLERVKAAKKYKEPASPDTNGLPNLPEGWCWASVEATADVTGGFAFKRGEFTNRGVQVVKMANVKAGHLDLNRSPFFIPSASIFLLDKAGLVDGDLVITLTGTRNKRDYGAVAKVKTHPPVLLNQRMARIRCHPPMDSGYMMLCLQSEVYRDRFFAHETGNVGQGNVGMRAVRIEPIPIAPEAEQLRIVEEHERLLSIASDIQSAVHWNTVRCQRLRQSILKWAFEGRLVDQYPNDEPASVLLERIKDERAAQENSKKNSLKSGRKRRAK